MPEAVAIGDNLLVARLITRYSIMHHPGGINSDVKDCNTLGNLFLRKGKFASASAPCLTDGEGQSEAVTKKNANLHPCPVGINTTGNL